MGSSTLIKSFEKMDLRPSTMLVFFYLREQARANEDGRTACAPRVLADRLDFTEKVVRTALRELTDAGLVKLDTHARRFTMVSFPQDAHRRAGAEKGAEKGAANLFRNRIVLQHAGAEKGAEKGATGVTAVRRSSPRGVVVDSELKEVGEKRPDAPIFVHKSKPTAAARYEAAIERAPQLPNVTLHVDRLFAELSGGHKYPWAGNPTAATALADLIFSHGAPLVMAAAERYFIRGNPWTEERAWAIDEFSRQFAKLIAVDGVTKRSAALKAELGEQAQPATPRELKAQLDAIRRRSEAEIDGYKPEEIHLADDLRRIAQGKDLAVT